MKFDHKRRARRVFAALCAMLAPVLAGTGVHAADALELPPGPNRDLVYGACRTCHDLQYLTESAGITRDDWDAAIDGMRQYGLRIPPERRGKILDYLATYLGPSPPPKNAALAKAEPADAPSGARLFAEQCAACHKKNGAGQPGAFPPLAGNHDLMRDRLFPTYVLLYGLSGRISVKGGSYNGEMPSFAHLSDGEIAALTEYIRTAWNNAALRPAGLTPINAAAVKTARAKSMSAADVHAYRTRLP